MQAVIRPKTFRKMFGLPCWNVKPGLFPGLTLEFGQPHLIINREPQPPKPGWSHRLREHMARRIVVVHGDWHLWIYFCHWSVSVHGKKAGDSSTKRRIERGAQALAGQALVDVEVRHRGCRTFFRFDLGGLLQTWPINRKSDMWHLWTPSGKVFTLRGDKTYQFGADEEWRPLLSLAEPGDCV